jgi:hypothetical protein
MPKTATGTPKMMRTLALLLLLALPLAGCLSGGPDGAADVAPAADSPAAPQPIHPEGTPEFCSDNSTCDFWDEDYHQYVVYDLDTTVFDVVIVPSGGPDAVGNAASRMSVEAWRDGIHHFASPWLNESFQMNIYVVGEDVPSLDAVQDPEIIVISTGALGVLGIGLEPKQIGCLLLAEGGETIREYPVHRHGNVEVRASDCTGTGFTCFALNFGGSDLRALYDLIAHEVGHCLGAGHVGDALDFRARYAPVSDIMSYQNNPEQVNCVSNMNVRVLEGVYGHLLDQPEQMWLPRGSFYTMNPLDYENVECVNPN